MPKLLSVNAQTILNERLGNSSYSIVEIQWSTGTTYYSDREVTFKGETTVNDVVNIGELSYTVREDNASDISSVDITLRDYDSTISNIFNVENIEGLNCTLYLMLDGFTDDDAIILIKGKITSPISYEEGNRLFSFNISSQFLGGEIGVEIEHVETITNKDVGAVVEENWSSTYTSRPLNHSDIDIAWTNPHHSYGNVTGYGYTSNYLKPLRYYFQKETRQLQNIRLKCHYQNQNTNTHLRMQLSSGEYWDLYETSWTVADVALSNIPDYVVFWLFGGGSGQGRIDEVWLEYEYIIVDVDNDEIVDIETKKIYNPAPVCFGTCIDVEALKISNYLGYVKDEINKDSQIINIGNSNLFPRDTEITIIIDKIVFKGGFYLADSDEFTIASRNYNAHGAFTPTIANRPKHMTTKDFVINYSGTKKLTNMYVCLKVTGQNVYQINKCINDDPPSGGVQKIKCQHNWIADPTYGLPQSGWELVSLSFWGSGLSPDWGTDTLVDGSPLVRDSWVIAEGAGVSLYNIVDEPSSEGDDEIVYIPNLLQSNEILSVKADYDGELTDVPTSNYTVLNNFKLNSSKYAGYSTCIIFDELLSTLDPKWSDDKILVSLRSSISDNIVSVIRYILELNTDLEIDNTSFLEVSEKLKNFPVHFSYNNVEDAFNFCTEIAKISRCALFIDQDKVKLKYLSETPTVDFNLTVDNVLQRSIVKTFTPKEDIVTRLKATYNSTDIPIELSSDVKNNGLVIEETDYFIYYHKELAKYSVSYWLYRLSNIWKILEINCPFNMLKVSNFDIVEVDVPFVSSSKIKGIVQGMKIDLSTKIVNITILLASISGQNTENSNFWLGVPNYEVNNLIAKPSDPWVQ